MKNQNLTSIEQVINDLANSKDIKKGGLFDLPKVQRCKHPSHNPPTHIHIPQGKGYRHVCPACGNSQDIVPLQISL